MKRLAGIMFVYNGISMDYCYEQSILSMLKVCSHVYVLDAGSTDGTREHLEAIEKIEALKRNRITLIKCTTEEWEAQKGKEKLSHFTNIAIERAQKDGWEYILYVQADEVILESCKKAILDAVFEGGDGYMCTRINLWKSPYLKLEVPQNRKPCSTEVIRLTKSCYRAYDDAENINAPASFKYLPDIRIYHMGFVRKRDIMKHKVTYIQEEVFGVNHDPKLDGADEFQPDRWFDPKTDLKVIDEPLPEVIQEWAKQRVYKD